MLKRLLLLLPVLLLAACTASPVKEVSQVLDLSLPEGDVITDLDTHGGFHGDGESCIVLAFAPENGEALAAELAGRTDWQALPLDDLPTTVMESIIPLLEDDGLDYTVPTQGWYWYQDRSPSFPKLKIPHQSHADFCSTDTAGGLDNKKRRYAPRGGVAYRLFLWGFPKGATPPFGTRLCEAKCSVLYALPALP